MMTNNKIIAVLFIFISSITGYAQCNKATGLFVNNLTLTSANLNWTIPSGSIDLFEIRYRREIDNPWTYKTVSSSTSSNELTGLSVGSIYQWQIKTYCSGGTNSGFTNTQYFKTSIDYTCNPPQNVSTSGIGLTSATVNWTAISGTGVEYKVRYRKNIENQWKYIFNITSNSQLLTGLSVGTTYQVEVETECGEDNLTTSGFGTRVFFKTAIDYSCTPPSNPNTTTISTTSATLTWDAISGTSVEYKVRYRRNTVNEWTYIRNIATNSTNLTGLISGASYQWEVETECGEDNLTTSGFGTRQYFTTTIDYSCTPPSNPQTSTITSSSATLTWSAISGTGVEYKVRYRRNTVNEWTYIRNIATNSTNLTGLISGASYQWEVETECSADNFTTSGFGTRQYFTTAIDYSCTPPSNPNASVIGTTSATLTWDAISGTGVEYKVRYRKNSVNAWTYVFNIPSNSVTITGLSGGTAYQFEVETECSVDNLTTSGFGVRKYFTTGIDYACTPPTNMKVDTTTSSSATLSWDAISGTGVEYKVRYRRDIDNPWTYVRNLTTNSVFLSSLTSGMKYQWEVETECSEDNLTTSGFGTRQIFFTKTQFDCGNLKPSSSVVETGFVDALIAWPDMGAPSYQLDYRKVGATSFTSVTLSDTSYLVTNLDQNASYEYRLRSICSSSYVQNVSDYTEMFYFNTKSCTPPLSGFSVSSITDNSANISWGTVDGADGYVIFHTVKGSPNAIYDTVAINSISIGSLFSGTTYRYEVRTLCSVADNLTSAYSTSPVGNRHQFTTTGPVSCTPPSGLSVVDVTSSSVGLSWVQNSSLSYDVSIKASYEYNWVNEGPADGLSTHTYSSLFSGQGYNFRVRSVCTATLKSGWSSEVFAQTSGTSVCPTPTNVIVSSRTTDGGNVAWDLVDNATSYSIRYKKAEDDWTVINNINPNTYDFSGLLSGTDYSFQVKSVCNAQSVPESPHTGYYHLVTLSPSREAILSDDFGSISIYPNPVLNLVNVKSPNNKIENIEIYDLKGNLMFTKSTENVSDITLDLTNYVAGIYIIKIQSEDNVKAFRLNKI